MDQRLWYAPNLSELNGIVAVIIEGPGGQMYAIYEDVGYVIMKPTRTNVVVDPIYTSNMSLIPTTAATTNPGVWLIRNPYGYAAGYAFSPISSDPSEQSLIVAPDTVQGASVSVPRQLDPDALASLMMGDTVRSSVSTVYLSYEISRPSSINLAIANKSAPQLVILHFGQPVYAFRTSLDTSDPNVLLNRHVILRGHTNMYLTVVRKIDPSAAMSYPVAANDMLGVRYTLTPLWNHPEVGNGRTVTFVVFTCDYYTFDDATA